MALPFRWRWSYKERTCVMLYTIAVVLMLLWLIGLVSSYTLGGALHLMLIIAIILIVLRVFTGRRVA